MKHEALLILPYLLQSSYSSCNRVVVARIRTSFIVVPFTLYLCGVGIDHVCFRTTSLAINVTLLASTYYTYTQSSMSMTRATSSANASKQMALTALFLIIASLNAVAAYTPSRPVSPTRTVCHTSSSTTSTSESSSTSTNTNTSVPLQQLPETVPLPPHTFAGMVEAGVLQRFHGPAVARVTESWRLLDREYEHRAFVGHRFDAAADPATSNCHQLCHSYVPGLAAREFWNVAEHPWAARLAKSYRAIQKEFTKVTADTEQLVQEGNNIWAGALTEDASSYGVGWKTLVLMNRGVWDPVNVNLFPAAAKAVRDCGVPATEVFFASMQAGTSIQMHSDFTNFVLTSHLAVDIPYSGENKCRLTVGDETREWINGQVMMFDTSIMHNAVNESDKTRYILMIRLWHPDLTDIECEALQFTYDCLGNPGLVSADPGERFMAEQIVQAQRALPEIKKGTSVVQGFGGGGKNSKKKKK